MAFDELSNNNYKCDEDMKFARGKKRRHLSHNNLTLARANSRVFGNDGITSAKLSVKQLIDYLYSRK